ncbi:hypothetical protein NPIL_27051 [Nephila pilipes]|uniref:C2H2-type domain-containing protein n=1 Tax=Nephila pilipes TaxID=299642 RepID=A0A8X6PTD7_NEPPI|nr:hypothetical protein NPIL_27051 [Nephila pilipes]
MDFSETSQIETSELSIKGDSLFGPNMMPLPTSDEGKSVERAEENLEAENECRLQMKNYIEEFLKGEMIHVNSAIHSPVPSTSSGITGEHMSPCYSPDNDREFEKSKTSNLHGSEKEPKEIHSFKPSDCDNSVVSENVHGRDKVTGDKKCNFQCKTCGKLFKLQSRLKQPERMHTERRYTCEYCNRTHRDSYDLSVHVRIHTGEKPILCSQCPKRFSSSSSLNSHKRRVHSTERPYYPCPNCESRFTRKHRFEIHHRHWCNIINPCNDS